jgi:TolB-like protein
MGNLFAELKRRQMFRVAAAYAVVAWLLLQIVNNLAPGLNLPNWALTLVIVLLAVGFPIALVFAWIHQLAPADGTAPRTATTKLDYVLAGALILVIVLVSYQQLAPSRDSGAVQQPSNAPVGFAPQAAGISIAVLPFANVSGDVSQEFFSDGMTDEIIAALAKVPSLQIVARTSAFQFKGERNDMRAIGQALNARYLIDGAVRRAGNRVRITAQLVQADNGVGVWTDTYDRELTDVFAIQEDIAQAIAGALRVPLGLSQGANLVSNRDIDPASYEQFLRAKALVRARGTGGLQALTDAAALLEPVVLRHPEFAPAWAYLSEAYSLSTGEAFNPGSDPDAVRLDQAEAAARRAIQLAPDQADGYVSLSRVQQVRGDLIQGEELASKASALDPNNAEGLNQLGFVLQRAGRLQEALAIRQKVYALEPSAPRFNQLLADSLWLTGQDDSAIDLVNNAGGPARPLRLAMIYAAAGRFSEAADMLATIPAGNYRPGQVETAVRILRTAPAKPDSSQPLLNLERLGWVYLYVGEPDRVVDPEAFPFFTWHPKFAAVRKTEGFKATVRRFGVLAYWRTKGWPNLCRPVGADDFECD